jgi:hypothetical protein
LRITKIIDALKSLSKKTSSSEFPYALLRAYCLPESSIARLQIGSYNLSTQDGDILWKNRLFYSVCDSALHVAIHNAKSDERILKQTPRFLIVTDFKTLLAYDTKTDESLDIPIEKISDHYAFFLPWAGMEKASHQVENPVDVKAAERIGTLYELIESENPNIYQHTINIFITRLLFCFFAEDSGLFEKDAFTHSIYNFTAEDGSDLNEHVQSLFTALNEKCRDAYPIHLKVLPYVNGGLFEEVLEIPKFSAKSRIMIIEAGALDWAQISPDIFGSMCQAITDSEKRENFGIRYTTAQNIMKVIQPLFLDDLDGEFERAKGNIEKLDQLLERIDKLQFFDPACGTGNFLIIAYKELRRLEMKIFEEISRTCGQRETMIPRIQISQFYGIEIDAFAREIANLSLCMSVHQMNIESNQALGSKLVSLPLEDRAHIVCGNATKLDWEKVCPKKEKSEIYILGNPPYKGARLQNREQKAEMAEVFGQLRGFGNLDYITCWFFKASSYILGANASYAFVSTNSICQGEQVAIIWPHLLNEKLEIGFAHKSFKWTNNAKGNAGVTCVIVGVQTIRESAKRLFHEHHCKRVVNINSYLVAAPNIFVERRRSPIASVPLMKIGNKPIDGGHYLFSRDGKQAFIDHESQSAPYFRRWYGSREYINGLERWCLFVQGIPQNELSNMPETSKRMESVRQFRLASKSAPTRAIANKPKRFHVENFPASKFIVVPEVSSERREYIPMGFLAQSDLASNLLNVIDSSDLTLFGHLTSRLHMTWVRAVGGRLDMRYRYSAGICYNTYPFPYATEAQKKEVRKSVFSVLSERENHSEKTLADLYDPDRMPEGLRAAHRRLDEVVERCYRSKLFASDEERLEHLFKLHEEND